MNKRISALRFWVLFRIIPFFILQKFQKEIVMNFEIEKRQSSRAAMKFAGRVVAISGHIGRKSK